MFSICCSTVTASMTAAATTWRTQLGDPASRPSSAAFLPTTLTVRSYLPVSYFFFSICVSLSPFVFPSFFKKFQTCDFFSSFFLIPHFHKFQSRKFSPTPTHALARLTLPTDQNEIGPQFILPSPPRRHRRPTGRGWGVPTPLAENRVRPPAPRRGPPRPRRHHHARGLGTGDRPRPHPHRGDEG